jgi:hypothetical protein
MWSSDTPVVTDNKWAGTLTIPAAGDDSLGRHVICWHRPVIEEPSMSAVSDIYEIVGSAATNENVNLRSTMFPDG